MTHYDLIERAIIYLNEHAHEQPSLDEVAQHLGMSPFHLQRVFQEWAGVSPKKFLQFLNVEHAKTLLQENKSLLETSLEVGLSGTSRLHDLFVTIEGMTPGEFKHGGEALTIRYDFGGTPFGMVIVAATDKGICFVAFCDNENDGLVNLKARFPKARYVQTVDSNQRAVLALLNNKQASLSELKLHLKGTPFQLKVWQALLTVPPGRLVTYTDIAQVIESPKALRAVGTAIGSNPIAYIIPCHRVIRSTGIIGGYRWGRERKQALLGWELCSPSTRHRS